MLRSATRTWRGRIGLAVAAIVAVAVGTYGVLVLSTITAPPPAHLATPPNRGSFIAGGPETSGRPPQLACIGTQRPAATTSTTPDGDWVVAGQGTGGFVGYRATEILAFEFVRAPNDAVGRTHSVEGHLEIDGQTLTAASVDARVEHLASDVGMRDGHISEYLNFRAHPDATFALVQPVDIGEPTLGKVTRVDAVGDLTILDVTHRVTFPLEARWSGDNIDVAGQLVINRADYAMDIQQLLGFRVGEQITIELLLRFVRAGADPCAAPVASEKPDPSATPSPSIAVPDAIELDRLPDGWGEILFAGLPNPPGAAAPLGELYLLRGGDAEPSALTNTIAGIEDEPAWSSDGRRIAYTFSPPESAYSLWIANADGTAAAALTSASLRSASWSPDGSAIAAILDTDTGSNLVLVDVSSGTLRTILADAGVMDTPIWSPDGRHLAFALLVPGGTNEDVYLAGREGQDLRRLTSEPAYEYQPRWSPDGASIAFVRGGDLWIMGANGGNERQVTRGLTVDSPTWSPDGAHLAFVIAGSGPMLEGPERKALWFVEADGSGLSRLEFGLYQVAHPAWRPG